MAEVTPELVRELLDPRNVVTRAALASAAPAIAAAYLQVCEERDEWKAEYEAAAQGIDHELITTEVMLKNAQREIEQLQRAASEGASRALRDTEGRTKGAPDAPLRDTQGYSQDDEKRPASP